MTGAQSPKQPSALPRCKTARQARPVPFSSLPGARRAHCRPLTAALAPRRQSHGSAAARALGRAEARGRGMLSEWTRDRHVRHRSFLELREDKKVKEVVLDPRAGTALPS